VYVPAGTVGNTYVPSAAVVAVGSVVAASPSSRVNTTPSSGFPASSNTVPATLPASADSTKLLSRSSSPGSTFTGIDSSMTPSLSPTEGSSGEASSSLFRLQQ